MKLQSDWIALLRDFNAAGVEYLVIGATAVAYHGQPRATRDFDRIDLVRNKRAAGRHRDLADLELLGEPSAP